MAFFAAPPTLWPLRALLVALLVARCAALHVVVAGATGRVGREVVRILTRQGVSHVALTRDLSRAKRTLQRAVVEQPGGAVGACVVKYASLGAGRRCCAVSSEHRVSTRGYEYSGYR